MIRISNRPYSGHRWILLEEDIPHELIRKKDENLTYLILGHDPTNSSMIRSLVKNSDLSVVDSIGNYVTRVSLPKNKSLNGLADKIISLGGTIQEDLDQNL